MTNYRLLKKYIKRFKTQAKKNKDAHKVIKCINRVFGKKTTYWGDVVYTCHRLKEIYNL